MTNEVDSEDETEFTTLLDAMDTRTRQIIDQCLIYILPELFKVIVVLIESTPEKRQKFLTQEWPPPAKSSPTPEFAPSPDPAP